MLIHQNGSTRFDRDWKTWNQFGAPHKQQQQSSHQIFTGTNWFGNENLYHNTCVGQWWHTQNQFEILEIGFKMYIINRNNKKTSVLWFKMLERVWTD